MRASRVHRAILAYVLLQRHKNRRHFCVHHLNSQQKESGAFHVLVPELRMDREKFFNYFRMYPEQFDELEMKLRPHIQLQGSNWNLAIPSAETLAVTLRQV